MSITQLIFENSLFQTTIKNFIITTQNELTRRYDDNVIFAIKGTQAINSFIDKMISKDIELLPLRFPISDWDSEIFIIGNENNYNNLVNEINQLLINLLNNLRNELRAIIFPLVSSVGGTVNPVNDFIILADGTKSIINQEAQQIYISIILNIPEIYLIRLLSQVIVNGENILVEIFDITIPKNTDPSYINIVNIINNTVAFIKIDGINYFSPSYLYSEIIKLINNMIRGYQLLKEFNTTGNIQTYKQALTYLYRLDKLNKDLEKKRILEAIMCKLQIYDNPGVNESFCSIVNKIPPCEDIASLQIYSKFELLNFIKSSFPLLPVKYINYLTKQELCLIQAYLTYYKLNLPGVISTVNTITSAIIQQFMTLKINFISNGDLTSHHILLRNLLMEQDILQLNGIGTEYLLLRFLESYFASNVLKVTIMRFINTTSSSIQQYIISHDPELSTFMQSISPYVYGGVALNLLLGLPTSDWDVGIFFYPNANGISLINNQQYDYYQSIIDRYSQYAETVVETILYPLLVNNIKDIIKYGPSEMYQELKNYNLQFIDDNPLIYIKSYRPDNIYVLYKISLRLNYLPLNRELHYQFLDLLINKTNISANLNNYELHDNIYILKPSVLYENLIANLQNPEVYKTRLKKHVDLKRLAILQQILPSTMIQ